MDWPWNLAWKLFLVSTRKALFILHSKAWEVSTRNPGICWWLAWEFCSLKATSKFNLSHFSLCYKHSPSPIGAWNWIQYFSQHVAEWTEKSGELGEAAPGKILTDSRKTKAGLVVPVAFHLEVALLPWDLQWRINAARRTCPGSRMNLLTLFHRTKCFWRFSPVSSITVASLSSERWETAIT